MPLLLRKNCPCIERPYKEKSLYQIQQNLTDLLPSFDLRSYRILGNYPCVSLDISLLSSVGGLVRGRSRLSDYRPSVQASSAKASRLLLLLDRYSEVAQRRQLRLWQQHIHLQIPRCSQRHKSVSVVIGANARRIEIVIVAGTKFRTAGQG